MAMRDALNTDNYIIRNVIAGGKAVASDRLMIFYASFLILVLLLGVFGPHIAPYEEDEIVMDEDGIKRLSSPSLEHPLGTNDVGYDLFSRIVIGAQPTMLAGLIGGAMIISIGGTIGITAGYVGGRVETILMRLTDVAYGVPLIPFAIVLIAFLGTGFFFSVFIIGLVLWRGNARVLRSQVLQIKEREFILAAKATGASTPRIILAHILPNIAPMAILFFALGIGFTIIVQAGLSFVGVMDPFVPSWGIILRNAYNSGTAGYAYWWVLPPGFMISLTVVSAFMFGRKIEELVGEGGQDETLSL